MSLCFKTPIKRVTQNAQHFYGFYTEPNYDHKIQEIHLLHEPDTHFNKNKQNRLL